MPDGLDWLYRPALRGMYKIESLKDGSLDLEDVAEANEALDIEAENQARIEEAHRDKP
jgi:hypothetical protein